eukprot:scaffold33022_cov63-Phaeocystis_antarctica.AAC.2
MYAPEPPYWSRPHWSRPHWSRSLPTGHGASPLVTEPPHWSRVPAPCVLSVPEAQGSLAPGRHELYAPASGVLYHHRACRTTTDHTFLFRHHTFLFRHHTFLVPEHAMLLGLTAEMSPYATHASNRGPTASSPGPTASTPDEQARLEPRANRSGTHAFGPCLGRSRTLDTYARVGHLRSLALDRGYVSVLLPEIAWNLAYSHSVAPPILDSEAEPEPEPSPVPIPSPIPTLTLSRCGGASHSSRPRSATASVRRGCCGRHPYLLWLLVCSPWLYSPLPCSP